MYTVGAREVHAGVKHLLKCWAGEAGGTMSDTWMSAADICRDTHLVLFTDVMVSIGFSSAATNPAANKRNSHAHAQREAAVGASTCPLLVPRDSLETNIPKHIT
jgi:hypothetical protein